MFAISFKSDFDRLRKELRDDQKQVRFAMAVALTKTAQLDVKPAIRAEMEQVFEDPTRYTLNSLRVLPATKHHLVAMVWIKDEFGNDARKYLQPQMAGGPRVHKPFEKRLIRQELMPASLFAVPGQGVQLDRYGNISGPLIEKILSAVGAAEIYAGYQANRTARSAKRQGRRLRRFFVAGLDRRTQHLASGIWERMANGVRPIIIFVRRPVYQRRLRFNEVAMRAAIKGWPIRLNQALHLALRTRR